jgi:hypothetical protein
VYGSVYLTEDFGVGSPAFNSMSVWGDDVFSTEQDGYTSGDNINYQLIDGNNLYDIIPLYDNHEEGYILDFSANTFGGMLIGIESITPICGLQLGCTSDWADNYDELATIDDGSCYRYGCNSDWADNYDELATEDDGSCYRYGCTSDWADNYDELATEDNGYCYRYGCMAEWADNYDPYATDDNSHLPEEFSGSTGSNMTIFLTSADVIGRELTTPDVKNIVMLLPVEPENSSGK